jgi:hypothetical protein
MKIHSGSREMLKLNRQNTAEMAIWASLFFLKKKKKCVYYSQQLQWYEGIKLKTLNILHCIENIIECVYDLSLVLQECY